MEASEEYCPTDHCEQGTQTTRSEPPLAAGMWGTVNLGRYFPAVITKVETLLYADLCVFGDLDTGFPVSTVEHIQCTDIYPPPFHGQFCPDAWKKQ